VSARPLASPSRTSFPYDFFPPAPFLTILTARRLACGISLISLSAPRIFRLVYPARLHSPPTPVCLGFPLYFPSFLQIGMILVFLAALVCPVYHGDTGEARSDFGRAVFLLVGSGASTFCHSFPLVLFHLCRHPPPLS